MKKVIQMVFVEGCLQPVYQLEDGTWLFPFFYPREKVVRYRDIEYIKAFEGITEEDRREFIKAYFKLKKSE
jgi:hypothetical protein